MSGMELDKAVLQQLFLDARTHGHWQDKAVSDEQLQGIYDLAKWGPTSFNCSPLRLVFVKTAEAKQRLKPALMDANVEKTMAAPATIIVATDPKFYQRMDKLTPSAPDVDQMFINNQPLAEVTAFRNATLQGAYVIVAARALGLDCGPMSGFDNAVVDQAFFADSGYQSNFLINVGYGVDEKVYPRAPRLDFEEAAQVV
jgi:3-hydroxypropanoate dehydrogenase